MTRTTTLNLEWTLPSGHAAELAVLVSYDPAGHGDPLELGDLLGVRCLLWDGEDAPPAIADDVCGAFEAAWGTVTISNCILERLEDHVEGERNYAQSEGFAR
jgi:hypothetical protein